jgi:caa(3)-type oxidase subunit IV
MRDARQASPTVSTRTYVAVFAVLLALTATTIGLAFVPLGRWSTPVALGIAATKALLIAAVFMHLRHGTVTSRLAAVAGLLWLSILLAGTLDDVITRGWLPVPGK